MLVLLGLHSFQETEHLEQREPWISVLCVLVVRLRLTQFTREIYGQNRIAEGKVPMCAAMCSTKALLVGDAQEVANIYRARVSSKGKGVQSAPNSWSKAYGN